jgi:AcrR family transcriptional regulator
MTTPAQRRTQSERRNESEEALLDAAAELVAERGIERASLARIGERAGASRGLPTHHFGSKDALVARLARRAQLQIDQAARAAVATTGRSLDDFCSLELLRMAVDIDIGRFEHPTAYDRALIVMWGATFATEASLEGMQEADQRSLDDWANLIERGQADHSIRPDADARSSAVVLLGLARGLCAVFLTHAHHTDMTRVRQTCQEWITASLMP